LRVQKNSGSERGMATWGHGNLGAWEANLHGEMLRTRAATNRG